MSGTERVGTPASAPLDGAVRHAAAQAREVCAREVARHRAETAALRREHAEFRRTAARRGPRLAGQPGREGG